MVNPSDDDFKWNELDNDNALHSLMVDAFKKGSDSKKKEIRVFFKGIITDFEIGFDNGYDFGAETPKDARKGKELHSFRTKQCEICNNQSSFAKFWPTMFGQTIGKTSLCKKCSKGGFI